MASSKKKSRNAAQMTSAQRRAKQEAARRSQDRWQSSKRILIVIAVILGIVIVAVVVAAVVNTNRENRNAAATSGAPSAQITPPDATTDGLAITLNPAASSAPLTLDIHADYQCPVCKTAETQVAQGLSQLANSNQVLVRYHIRSFLDSNLGNTSSTQAAIAATCADTVGSFQGYNAVVFANQPATEGTGYTNDQLRNTFATQAGITGDNLTKFQQCYDDKATSTFVANMEQGNNTTPISGIDQYSSGVRSTPAFIVNGKYVDWTKIPADSAGMLAYLQKVANGS